MTDTIFALSSGAPPAGIAVIRISGPHAHATHRRFAGARLPAARRASLANLRDPHSGAMLDQALTLRFDGPHSATGEDCIEWHCHGGRSVVAAVLDALEREPDLRPALPGEFTRRGFENGRMDLIEAEGLADLLTAETESQRRAALALVEGRLSRAVEGWREELLSCAAQLEAWLDFSDEDDVAQGGRPPATIAAALTALVADMRATLALPEAERLRDGVRVVIAGPPNAGKSTLLNALVGREAAIVSPVAGTTRDRVEVPAQLNGIAFLFTDTAGLRDETDDVIEAIGIDRARAAVEAADMVLWLGEPDEAPDRALRIGAQADREDRSDDCYALRLSARTGEGMQALVDHLVSEARVLIRPEADHALSIRQRRLIEQAVDALDSGIGETDPVLVAEEVRRARMALDALTGRAGIEDMLDALFGRFCIGK